MHLNSKNFDACSVVSGAALCILALDFLEVTFGSIVAIIIIITNSIIIWTTVWLIIWVFFSM